MIFLLYFVTNYKIWKQKLLSYRLWEVLTLEKRIILSQKYDIVCIFHGSDPRIDKYQAEYNFFISLFHYLSIDICYMVWSIKT